MNADLARLMTQRAAWLHDQGETLPGEAANMAKLAAAEAGIAALDQATLTHGGNGLSTEYGLATRGGLNEAHADRADQPGNDPQLCRQAQSRPADFLLGA